MNRTLLPASGAQSPPSGQWCIDMDNAASVLCNTHVLQHSCPALGLLGVGDTGRLVPTAMSQLEAALAADAPGQPEDMAPRALPLASFVADGMVGAGATAGLALPMSSGEQSVRPPPPAQLQQLSDSRRVQMMVRHVEQSLQLVPAVLAVVNALQKSGQWPTAAGQPVDSPAGALAERMRRLCRFLSWLGRAATLPKPVLATAEQLPELAASASEAWLLVQRRLLQLHSSQLAGAEDNHSGGDDGSGSDGSSSNSGSGGNSGNGEDVGLLDLDLRGCSMRLFRVCLAQCSRGLGSLYGTLRSQAASRQASSRQGAAAGPAAILQLPGLPTILQLVTTTSITARLAAGMQQEAADVATRRQQLQLLACSENEPPAACAAALLGYALSGMHYCAAVGLAGQAEGDELPPEGARDIGRCAGWHNPKPLLDAVAHWLGTLSLPRNSRLPVHNCITSARSWLLNLPGPSDAHAPSRSILLQAVWHATIRGHLRRRRTAGCSVRRACPGWRCH